MNHPEFEMGQITVRFIENILRYFNLKYARIAERKILRYMADVLVNGNPDVAKIDHSKVFHTPKVPNSIVMKILPAQNKCSMILVPEKFAKWLKDQKQVMFTDTTLRDAHQSLLATRVRTQDMLKVAESFAHRHPELFSMEVWGGATFDVALRFCMNVLGKD